MEKENKKNTTKKGDDFEDKVFHFVRYALNSGQFGINPERSKVFKKKGYFSKDRDDNIIFDLSIEIFIFQQNEWSILFLFECKDYSKSIGVNEIEEFYAKVLQVSGLNVKAFFVTNSKLQKSAIKYANSKGITLIGANSDFNFDISNPIFAAYQSNVFKFVPIIMPIIGAVISTGWNLLLSNRYKLTEIEKKIVELTFKSIVLQLKTDETKQIE